MKMLKLLFFVLLITNLCDCGTLPASQLAEQTLITRLLDGYNKNIRPDNQVYVDITAALKQVVAIDEKQQIMTSSSFISQTWYDDRLSWIRNSSTNIEVIMLPVKSLWIPDTMILNSADGNGYLTVNDYSLASVDYTGQVYMILPALTIKTRCDFFVQKFPFDKQMCSINLTSWSQGSNRIMYTENDSFVLDLDEYSEHSLWKLEKTNLIVIEAEDRAPFEYTDNAVISIQLYLQRKPLFFMLNGIVACFILNCVTLLSFALPFASQISLCMICFMTYSVYSLNFSSLFPQQSEYLMMITLYFLLSIFWTLISMIWFIISNHFVTKAQMSKPFYAFSGLLQKTCCCCCSSSNDKTDKKVDTIVEDGEFNKSMDENNTEVITIENMKYLPGQKISPLHFQRPIALENIYRRQDYPINDIESIRINEKTTSKCNFCNRCKLCQDDFDKDKTKDKNKKDIEAKCSALNYLVLLCVSLFMLVSNIVVWVLMAR